MSYLEAMHENCADCHKEKAEEVERPHLGDCRTCHQSLDPAWLETDRVATTRERNPLG